MRRLLLVAVCLCLGCPWRPAAQAAEIAVISSSSIGPYREAVGGFERALKERGRSFSITEYSISREQGASVFQQIMRGNPDLIFAVGPEALRLAREKAGNLPIVFTMVLRPEAAVNVTGVSLAIPFRVQLDHIRRSLPNVRKIGVFYSSGSARSYREISQACRDKDLTLVARRIESGGDLPAAFRDISGQIDIFLMIPDSKIFFIKSIQYLLQESLKKGLPVIGLSSSYTRAGALISFECDYGNLGWRAGIIAARIIDGERPGALAPGAPEKIRFSVNLVVARRLGIKFNPRTLQEASEVFGE